MNTPMATRWLATLLVVAASNASAAPEEKPSGAALEAAKAEVEAQREALLDQREASRVEREQARQALAEARRELREKAREVARLSAEVHPGRAYAYEFLAQPRRAMLGVVIGSAERDGEGSGLQVLAVSPGGPADQAGIQAGDVLLAIGDRRLEDAEAPEAALREVLAGLEEGRSVALEYRRDGDTATVEVTAERRVPFPFGAAAPEPPKTPRPPEPPEPPDAAPGPPAERSVELRQLLESGGVFWGALELAALNEELGAYFGTNEGLLVVSVPAEFPAELEGGDVLLGIGEREPRDPPHAFRILRSYAAGEKVTLEIMRREQRREISFEVPERAVSLRGPDAPPSPLHPHRPGGRGHDAPAANSRLEARIALF